jgi:hypothetical protein
VPGLFAAGVQAGAGAVAGGYGLLGFQRGLNMNITTDQAIVVSATTYILRRIIATNASLSLTLAVGGVYTAISKGGTVLVAATQIYSALTGVAPALDLTLAAGALGTTLGVTPIYLSLTTAQGAAATADFYLYGERLA